MSMLSAQCDELRTMAESVGLAMPQAATLMMEAADTIWELRCKCAGMVDMRERARLAETENAKLRELLSIMAYCNQFRRDCDGCSMNGAAGIITERAGCDELLARLRELGVEV